MEKRLTFFASSAKTSLHCAESSDSDGSIIYVKIKLCVYKLIDKSFITSACRINGNIWLARRICISFIKPNFDEN